MPPHLILGYTIGEWVGIVTIAGSLISAIVFLFNSLVVKPLTSSINHLADGLDDFQQSSNADHQRYDHELNDHETRIRILEKEEGEYGHHQSV